MNELFEQDKQSGENKHEKMIIDSIGSAEILHNHGILGLTTEQWDVVKSAIRIACNEAVKVDRTEMSKRVYVNDKAKIAISLIPLPFPQQPDEI